MVALAACNSTPKQTPPASGSGAAPAGIAVADAAAPGPAAPEPGPSAELRAALGLDSPNVPALASDVTARFAVDTADEVVADKTAKTLPGKVLVYRVAGGTVELEVTAVTPRNAIVIDWAWRDSSELVLMIGTHAETHFDYSLQRVLDGKVEDLPWPEAKHFKTTRPPTNTHSYDRLFVTASGEVWMNLCRKRQERDPHDCTDHVSVRVVPSSTGPAATGPVRAAPTPLAAPAGWSASVEPAGGRKTGPIACTGPGGIAATVAPREQRSFGFRAGGRWLSHHPPLQLVEEEVGGEGAEANVVTSVEPWFVKECTLVDAIASLTEAGPAGFWTVFDGHAVNTKRGGAVVLWHGRVLATIAGAERVAFAP